MYNPIILQICGTSGSGKSTLMRRIMTASREHLPIFERSRGDKKPMYYSMRIPEMPAPLTVLGSYENMAGGCDTIPTLDTTFNLVKDLWSKGNCVAFEGLLVSKNFKRGLDLFQMAGQHLHVIGLTTPLSVCYQSIYDRRVAAGKPKGEQPGATERDKRAHDNYVHKMKQIGANVYKVDREQAFGIAMSVLRGVKP